MGYKGGVAITIYHYPKCSTCRKALAWLARQEVEVTAVDIVKSPPSRAVLERARRLADVPVKKLFNVSGKAYRAGGFAAKLSEMTEAQALAALAADGKLIKRPLVVGDDVALVGFSEAAWQAALA